MVARLIKATLSGSGIHTSVYSAHSTRGASASNATNLGVPTDTILSAGSWNSESTFTRFYRRARTCASVSSPLGIWFFGTLFTLTYSFRDDMCFKFTVIDPGRTTW